MFQIHVEDPEILKIFDHNKLILEKYDPITKIAVFEEKDNIINDSIKDFYKIINRELLYQEKLTETAKKELLQMDMKEALNSLTPNNIIQLLKNLQPTIEEDNEIKRRIFMNKDIFKVLLQRIETWPIIDFIHELDMNNPLDIEIIEKILLENEFFQLLFNKIDAYNFTNLISFLNEGDNPKYEELKEKILLDNEKLNFLINHMKAYEYTNVILTLHPDTEENNKIKTKMCLNEKILKIYLEKPNIPKSKNSDLVDLIQATSEDEKGLIEIAKELLTNEKYLNIIGETTEAFDILGTLKFTIINKEPILIKEILKNNTIQNILKKYNNLNLFLEYYDNKGIRNDTYKMIKEELISNNEILDSLINALANSEPSNIRYFIRILIEDDMITELFSKKSSQNEIYMEKLLNKLDSSDIITIIRDKSLKNKPEKAEKILAYEKVINIIQNPKDIKKLVESLKELDPYFEVSQRIRNLLFEEENTLNRIFNLLKESDKDSTVKLLNILIGLLINNAKENENIVKKIFTDEKYLDVILMKVSSQDMINIFRKSLMKNRQKFVKELLKNPKIVQKLNTIENTQEALECFVEILYDPTYIVDYHHLLNLLKRDDIIDTILKASFEVKSTFYKRLKVAIEKALNNEEIINDNGYLVDKINTFINQVEEKSYTKTINQNIISSPNGNAIIFKFNRGTYVIKENGDYIETNLDKGIYTINKDNQKETNYLYGYDRHYEAVANSLMKFGFSKSEFRSFDESLYEYGKYGASKEMLVIVIEGEQIQLYIPNKITSEQNSVLEKIIKEMKEYENNNNKRFEYYIVHNEEHIDTIGIRPIFIRDLPIIFEKEEIITNNKCTI